MSTLINHRTHDFEAEAHQPIDTTVRLITPERITFTYPLASPFRRGLAYLIDAVILTLLIVIGIAIGLLLTLGNAAGIGIALAISFGLIWGYGIVCEGVFNGQTPGKKLSGIRVVTTKGVPITGSQAAIRNLIGTIDGPIPFLFVPGFVSMMLTRRFQRLGDLAAGTMVIIEEVRYEAKLSAVNDPAVMDLIALLPLRVPGNSEQVRALSDYVKHRGRFGPDLREEIARPLADPIRARHALPESSRGDAVLCAYYHRLISEMRVVDRLTERQTGWQELQLLLFRLETTRARRVEPAEILRLGELYRSACADLMLAEAHNLPRDTVAFLDALVGRAHNAVYKTQGFYWTDWVALIFDEVPRRLRSDVFLRVSALVFWGLFLITAFLGAADPEFSRRVVGDQQVASMEAMYDAPRDGERNFDRNDAQMAGFYIYNNPWIGLKCYAWGLLLGLGSLYILASNAISIGAIFGHMATIPQASQFFPFVTAHAPFELTAIVFSGGAGLRLGFGIVVTHGQSRLASLRREAERSLPTAGVAVILFILAAFVEGFVSPSGLAFWVKASIAIGSALLLLVYLLVLGREPKATALTGSEVTLGG